MKKESLLLWASVLGVFCYFQFTSTEATAETSTVTHAEAAEFELAEPMGQMLKFMDKLHFSGEEENWELANFYLHELEEQAESIVEGNVHEDGADVSHLVDSLLVPQIEELELATKAGDSIKFKQQYGELVDRCNTCHETTQHGFIRVKTPELSMFKNQDFSKR